MRPIDTTYTSPLYHFPQGSFNLQSHRRYFSKSKQIRNEEPKNRNYFQRYLDNTPKGWEIVYMTSIVWLFHVGFVHRFLNDVKYQLPPEITFTQEETSKLNQMTQSLMENNQHFIRNESSRVQVLMASTVIATYRCLSDKKLSHDDIIEILDGAFQRTNWMHFFFHSNRFITKLETISNLFHRAARLQGEGFLFEEVIDRGMEATLPAFLNIYIKKCLFFEFLAANGHSYLCGLFCAAEIRLFDYLDPMRDHMEFESTSQIASGDAYCSFKFKRMQPLDDPEPANQYIFEKKGEQDQQK